MSEIWFDCNGNPIDVPPNAVAWQVRRQVARGAPRLMYDGQGRPLLLPITVEHDELRRAVEVAGLYRLYPVDEDRRPITGAPVAYVPVGPTPSQDQAPSDPLTAAPPAATEAEALLDELSALSRTSLALARQIIAWVPVLVHTADALLRISDDADAAITTAISDLTK